MDDIFVASKQKAKNAYGQNGYQGPSSDLPGQHTVMDRDFGLATDPDVAITDQPGETGNWQTRAVSAEQYAAHPGMKSPDSKSEFPTANVRPVSKRALGGNFQR